MANIGSAVLITCFVTAISTTAAAADTFRTRAPQEHIDAFMSSCKADNIPTATCSCMAKKLAETREGDAALDAVGLMKYRLTDTDRKAGMVPLLNRHGMRMSELKTIMASGNPLFQAVSNQCK